MENLRRLVHKVTHRIWYWLSLNKQKETKPNDQRPYRYPTSTLSSAKAPARYPKKSNNQKIESAPIALLALSFSILPSSHPPFNKRRPPRRREPQACHHSNIILSFICHPRSSKNTLASTLAVRVGKPGVLQCNECIYM